jgi:carboxymethylenebutenolidase
MTDDLSRRDFVAMSVAAGMALAASDLTAQGLQVSEKDVTIKTPDGTCDAAFIHPASGTHPGVLIWPDAFGLRPTLRDMGKRLAAEGYSVLIPNPFYRVAKAPIDLNPATFNFGDPEQRAKLTPLMGSINAAGAAERDAQAYIAFLDSQPQVNKARKIGTQGYCMGGPLIVRTAAASDRIGAAASFHGGGLVTKEPTSPHLLIPKIRARMYFGVAANDDKQQPEAKDVLRKAMADAKVQGEVELYSNAQHGWCMPDFPTIYAKEDAEKAWAKLLTLYKAGLA